MLLALSIPPENIKKALAFYVFRGYRNRPVAFYMAKS